MSKQAYFTLYLVATMLAIMGFYAIGPRLETIFYPPYTKFDLVSVEEVDALRSKLVFTFTKQRMCEPRGLSWYDGEAGVSRHLNFNVTAIREDILPLGTHTSRPYVIDIPAKFVKTSLVGEIYSQCWPLWVSTSKVYP